MTPRLEPGPWMAKCGRIFDIRPMEAEIDGFAFFCPKTGYRWTRLGAFRTGYENHRFDLVDMVVPPANLRPQEPDQPWATLALLRSLGWSVAVHNDYRLRGQAMTFWLLTHPSGRWIKGEGMSDEAALIEALRQTEGDRA